jgi:PAS domain S-box-containing protein
MNPVLAAPSAESWIAPVAQAVDELVWVREPGTNRITFANAAFLRFWGVTAADHDGPHLRPLEPVHPDDLGRLAALHARLPEQGFQAEYRVLLAARAGTEARTARLAEQAIPMRTPSGALRVTHVARELSSQQDDAARLRAEISRRTDAERDLDQATRRLSTLIATANDAVITIDEESRVIDWNQAAERIFGWRQHETQGRVLTDLIVPRAHHAAHHGGIAHYLREGSARIFGRRVETTAVRRSGEEFDIELSVWPVRTGAHHTFSSFIRDISQRKAAERALAESEAKYRKVVENVSEGILVTSAGRILYANPSALALTGQDEETALRKPFIEFIHPDDRARVLENHVRRLRGEAVDNRYQFRVVTTGGEVRWLEISGVVLEWQNAPATLNFLTDITQRRQAEDEIRFALARERELSEMKSRFVAVASHEFRTPLAAILSSIELLDDYGTRLPEAERKEVVGLIKGAVARMNGMVEQVLLTSRLEAGQFVFEPQPLAVGPLLVQLVTELDQAHAQSSRIALRWDAGGTGAEVRRIDARLLRHILVNLLGNALKYSPADAPVRCTATADGDTLCLSIVDRGIGIPPQDLPRLFERFHRGTNVGNVQGTGIGLHVVRECVQLHGGTITVDSPPGAGTTFRVRLHAPAAG